MNALGMMKMLMMIYEFYNFAIVIFIFFNFRKNVIFSLKTIIIGVPVDN